MLLCRTPWFRRMEEDLFLQEPVVDVTEVAWWSDEVALVRAYLAANEAEKPRWLRPFVRKASRALLEEFQNCPVCIWSGPTVWQFHDGATSEQLCCTGCIILRARASRWLCSIDKLDAAGHGEIRV